MNCTRPVAAVIVVLATGLGSACSLQRVRTPQNPGEADLVMLLPDPERDTTGRAAVSNAGASAELDAAGEYTLVGVNQPPTRVKMMKESEVKRLYGDVLASLPPAPKHFTLYFRFESEELTAESRASIPSILESVKRHPAPEVLVVGHTDTTGAAARNVELGLRRARTVREMLIASQLDSATIEVASHGETDLLIKTGDEVFEPRNRRVDISVR